MEKSVKLSYIYALLSVFMWGTMATMSKLLQNNMDTMIVLVYTCLFSTLILLIYNIFKHKIRTLLQLPISVIIKMILIGSLGVFFYCLFFYMGCRRLPAQQAMVVNDLWPALIIVFSAVILHETMTAAKVCAVLLSFIGIIIVVTNGDISGFKNISMAGVAFCLIDAFCYALYSVLGKREAYDKDIAVMVAYASATVIAFICSAFMGTFCIPAGSDLAGLIFNGLICNAFPALLWALALDMGNTAVIANLAYLVPFISLLVTHFVLGEQITVWSVLGLVLIVSGILIQFKGVKAR